MYGNRNQGTIQAQGALTLLELLLSHIPLVLLGQNLWRSSHEKRGKLRQAAFSVGCWDVLEVAFNPGRSLAVGLVTGVPLLMSPEEVWNPG